MGEPRFGTGAKRGLRGRGDGVQKRGGRKREAARLAAELGTGGIQAGASCRGDWAVSRGARGRPGQYASPDASRAELLRGRRLCRGSEGSGRGCEGGSWKRGIAPLAGAELLERQTIFVRPG